MLMFQGNFMYEDQKHQKAQNKTFLKSFLDVKTV